MCTSSAQPGARDPGSAGSVSQSRGHQRPRQPRNYKPRAGSRQQQTKARRACVRALTGDGTTFNDVPWNRPLYEHLGFRVLADQEIAPGLRAVMATEAAHGLDAASRVAMRKDSRLEGDGAPP